MPCINIPSLHDNQMTISPTWQALHESVGGDFVRSRQLYKQLQSPEFISYFGNWIAARNDFRAGKYKSVLEAAKAHNVSQVINDEGEPRIVYHNSAVSISEFDIDKTFGGFYFSLNPDTSYKTSVGDILHSVFLNIKNPSIDEGLQSGEVDREWINQKLIPAGYDGIEGRGNSEYVAFSPNQIKSIINTGAFSKSENIYYNRDIFKAQQDARAAEIFTKVADTLAAKLGVSYKVINAEQAKLITSESAVKWNGETAFAYKGNVYVLENGMNLTNGIHEYGHFFVNAINKHNPTLFTKVYNDFITTSEGALTDAEVRRDYSDFSEDDIQQEVVTRALTAIAEDRITNPKVKGILSRIWFALKQLLKEVFGREHKVSNLDENTTLDQLAEMLVGDNLKINTEAVSDDDVIRFKRETEEMKEDFKKLNESQLVSAVDRFDTIVKEHTRNVMSNQRYKDVKETLTQDNDRNQLITLKDILSRAKEAGTDEDGLNKKARQLAYTIESIDLFTTKILDRIRELNDMTDHKERLGILSYYQFLLGDWARTMEQFETELKDAKIGAGTVLYDTISSIQSKLNNSLKEINSNNKEAIFDLMKEMLENVREDIDKIHAERIKLYSEDLAKGNYSAQLFIDKENKAYEQRFNLSDANIRAYLNGDKGDTNQFSGFLEAYISSPDPIVGGFTKFLKTAKYEIEVSARKKSLAMRAELDPLYKKLSIDRSNPGALGKQITFVDKVLRFEDGKPVEGQVVALLNQFRNHRYEIDLKNHFIEKAKAEGRDQDVRQLRKELNEELGNYFHREYSDDYYKAQEVWKTDIGAKAYEARLEIYDQINSINDTMSKDPLVRDQQLEEIKLLRKQVQQLGSLKDLNGEYKTGEDLEIARVIKQYNELSRPFYEWKEREGLFEERMNEAKQLIIEDGFAEGTPEYKEKLQNWLDENTRRVIDPSFYEDRKRITDEIAEILSTLPDTDRKNLDSEAVWTEIIDIVTGYRDQDGQPIGVDLNENQVSKVQELQEKLQAIKEEYASVGGLTKDESEEMSYLFEEAKNKTISAEERLRLNELVQKKNDSKLDALQKARFFVLIQQLQDLQSKVATEYYTEVVNNYLSKANIAPITEITAGSVLDPSFIDPILKANPEFDTWFQKNHISKTIWNPATKQHEVTYERLYIWNRIEPNDPKYTKKKTLSDGTVINGLPTYEYFRRQVKPEFRTKRVIGTTVDNKGNWMPKTLAEGAKDAKYINEDYHKLAAASPDTFKILEIMTKHHLANQEGLYSGNKLGFDLPRFRKNKLEYLRDGKFKEDAVNKAGEIKESITSLFAKRNDDYASGAGNFDEEIAERLVNADMFDNEISRIPIKGLAHLPVDQVSLDVGGSILRYMVSAETNKKLIEINPYAKALLNVLDENGVKDIHAINLKKFRTSGIKTFINSNKNNRLQILTNLYEREFQGIEHNLELGHFANKTANAMMKAAAWGSLALDIPGSIKNVFAANIQNFLESLGGAHINKMEYAKGTSMMTRSYIPALITDYNKFSGQSLQTQMFQMFDPIQGRFFDKLGKEMTASNLGNFIGGHWAFSPREFGEIEAQGSFWLGMMLHTKVKQIIGEEVKEISYAEAFELKDGEVKLKDGIDPEYAEGGKKFLEFKLKLHELNQKLQGNYANIDQPEMQRYTIGRLFNFMRRYMVPAAINRFSPERIQVGMGGTREGYYITSLKVLQNLIKTAKLNWHLYTPEQKRNVHKTLGEAALSITFLLLLRALGWDPDDEEKYTKLKNNSWATNMLIYELMAVKSESEQFIPLPGMGLDELVRLKNTPSIAFGHFDKYYRIVGDVMNFGAVGLGIEQSDVLRYQAKQGIWEKDDLKIVAHLSRLAGFTGTTVSPEVAIKNFNLIQSRTK